MKLIIYYLTHNKFSLFDLGVLFVCSRLILDARFIDATLWLTASIFVSLVLDSIQSHKEKPDD